MWVTKMVLLNMYIFESDIEDVSNATPVTTIFDGKIVYEQGAQEDE